MLNMKEIFEKSNLRLKEFLNSNFKTLFLYTIIVFITFSFEDIIISLFDKYILAFFDVETTVFTFSLFVLILFFLVILIIKSYKRRFEISFFNFSLFTFLVGIYIYFRIKNYYSLDYFYLPINYPIGYLDLLFFLLFAFTIFTFLFRVINHVNSENRKKIEKISYVDSIGYIQDQPITKPINDLLDYDIDAAKLAKDIENIPINSSCSIGIIGNWGRGKSTYLNLVEYHINKSKFIIIKFNPRHSKSATNIQEDFFNLLFSELKKFNSEFSSLFKDYMKAIGIIGKNNFFSIVLNLYKIWNKEDEKKRLNNAITNLPKRVIILIEDFDRFTFR